MQKKVSHNLIKTASNDTAKLSLNLKPATDVNLTGSWKFGFRYQGKSELGNMELRQNNQTFSGHGKDETSGTPFTIEHGLIKGSEILFLKRYNNSPNQSVQYHGQFSYLPSEQGELPYMGGDFSLESNGALAAGDWEAVMNVEQKNLSNSKKVVDQPKVENTVFEHIPHLSGKWDLAYEYNFKTIHATMFLEQDGNKLSGHGMDLDTKEKFVIKKGWYTFPHLTFIRQYIGKSQIGKPVVFKAEVEEVSDKDYTGPYLSGKTQGGGQWEAERVN